MATTCITEQAKLDMFNGGLCLQTTQSSLAGAGSNAAFTITGLATTAGVAVGMAAGGTNVAAGAIVASVDSASQVTVSKAHTGVVTTGTISFTGDVCKILLIKASPAGTYDQTLLNVGTPGSGSPTTTNVGTDEVTGTGYSSGGVTLTNVSAVLSSTTAVASFSVNPSWTTATFTAIAAVIYNTTARIGAGATPLNNHTISIHDFGGSQSVSAGTFTLVVPTANSSTGLLRIN